MIYAWLIYNKKDYIKNEYFATQLITYARNNGIHLELVLRHQISLGIKKNVLFIHYKDSNIVPEFVINRSRDSFLAKQFELMGIRVYNTCYVTDLCNHKAKTHQFVSKLAIPAVDTLFYSKKHLDLGYKEFTYPLILKSASGHGGNEVFKCESQDQFKQYLCNIQEEDFLVQRICGSPGIDIRVFVLGDQIIGAIKRESNIDFRSNYSLGGQASIYKLNEENRDYVEKIIKNLSSDFIGIDFILDGEGRFLFNEIEDVVGSRTLYYYAQVDVAQLYITYIKKTVDL